MEVLEHLKVLTSLNASQDFKLFYVNEEASKMFRSTLTVRVVDVFDLTQFSTPIVFNASVSDHNSNVSAICQLPKNCAAASCSLTDSLEFYGLSENLKAKVSVLAAGQTTKLTCRDGSQHLESCSSRGQLVPHPTMFNCATDYVEPLETAKKSVSSCNKCFKRGTESCGPADENSTDLYCNCSPDYMMSTCWKKVDLCVNVTCSNHGTCQMLDVEAVCECDFGYEGDLCEVDRNPASHRNSSSFIGRIDLADATAMVAVQLSFWSVLGLLSKLLGKVIIANDEDDPQEIYQTLRGVILTFATMCVLFFYNPNFLRISPTTCRLYFLIVHFAFGWACSQWIFEGFNVNEVLRCRQKNQWDLDFESRKRMYFGAMPRILPCFLFLISVYVIIYNANWSKIASTWTCLGVTCELTTNLWLPIGFFLLCMGLLATAFAENSYLVIQFVYSLSKLGFTLFSKRALRRPLLHLKVRSELEKFDGFKMGQVTEKCLRNVTWSLCGIWCLELLWVFTILASDHPKDKVFAGSAFLLSFAYCFISAAQGIITCPSTYAKASHFFMERLPPFLAPQFEPVQFWTRKERLARKAAKMNKERPEGTDPFSDPASEEYIPENAVAYMEHRWKRKGSELFEQKIQVEEIFTTLLLGELKSLRKSNASHFRDVQIMHLFVQWKQKVMQKGPEKYFQHNISVILEKTRLCTVDPDGNVELREFFVVPPISPVFLRPDVLAPERLEQEALINCVEELLKQGEDGKPRKLENGEGGDIGEIDAEDFLQRSFVAARRQVSEGHSFLEAAQNL
ncbi:unnamed protein product [Caenorhabditis auriculariae]|uniref:EGF-like domain-containing protein n=1 Tax=Caenorhabditis auriculariae TaxID=2777116 RepID=A0A8S1GNN9_9PELO|nr:unnamed protein product [Caenorhabditis auriculariae]